jgi:hypothetical protein
MTTIAFSYKGAPAALRWGRHAVERLRPERFDT